MSLSFFFFSCFRHAQDSLTPQQDGETQLEEDSFGPKRLKIPFQFTDTDLVTPHGSNALTSLLYLLHVLV